MEIKDWDSRNTLFYNNNFDMIQDYLINTLPAPVISGAIKNEMENAWIAGVQYLPIKLVSNNDNKIEIPGYYILNILNKEPKEVINPELSRTVGDLPWYAWVWLYESKLQWFDLFRIEGEDFEFYISDKMRKIINKHVHSVEFSKVPMSE
jgi:hypothetical protein